MNLSEFYRGKRVLVTGNTGFKGAWLTRILTLLGAEVTGYSMDAPTDPAFYHILKLDETIRQVTGDIRDLEKLSETFRKVQPEIVLHLAAQPIVSGFTFALMMTCIGILLILGTLVVLLAFGALS